jgi:serine protease Do
LLLVAACWAMLACRPAPAGERPGPRERSDDRGSGRMGVPNGKNDGPVKAAFREVLASASLATVRIRADGQNVALGAVVAADGYVVTKASLLEGKLACRFKDGTEKEAKLVGQDDDYDLALLHVEAAHLPVVAWREGAPPPPGSFVATTLPADEPLLVGAVSTEPRRISGFRTQRRPKGWLGIELGGESGTRIEKVEDHSPAAKADLHAGDEIRKIDGEAMRSAEQIVALVGGHSPKQTLRLVVHREDKDVELSATLARPRTERAPQDEWGGGPFSDRRSAFPAAFPHDTPLLPRDCGGPLVDTDGRVVGINIARALRVVSYAVPAADVRQVIDELKRKAQSVAKP